MNIRAKWYFIILLLICYVANVLSDAYFGMYIKGKTRIVANDHLYKIASYFSYSRSRYARRFNCQISFIRVLDKMENDLQSKVTVLEGGIGQSFLDLLLESPIRVPIAVQIVIGCYKNLRKRNKFTGKINDHIIEPATGSNTTDGIQNRPQDLNVKGSETYLGPATGSNIPSEIKYSPQYLMIGGFETILELGKEESTTINKTADEIETDDTKAPLENINPDNQQTIPDPNKDKVIEPNDSKVTPIKNNNQPEGDKKVPASGKTKPNVEASLVEINQDDNQNLPGPNEDEVIEPLGSNVTLIKDNNQTEDDTKVSASGKTKPNVEASLVEINQDDNQNLPGPNEDEVIEPLGSNVTLIKDNNQTEDDTKVSASGKTKPNVEASLVEINQDDNQNLPGPNEDEVIEPLGSNVTLIKDNNQTEDDTKVSASGKTKPNVEASLVEINQDDNQNLPGPNEDEVIEPLGSNVTLIKDNNQTEDDTKVPASGKTKPNVEASLVEINQDDNQNLPDPNEDEVIEPLGSNVTSIKDNNQTEDDTKVSASGKNGEGESGPNNKAPLENINPVKQTISNPDEDEDAGLPSNVIP